MEEQYLNKFGKSIFDEVFSLDEMYTIFIKILQSEQETTFEGLNGIFDIIIYAKILNNYKGSYEFPFCFNNVLEVNVNTCILPSMKRTEFSKCCCKVVNQYCTITSTSIWYVKHEVNH